MVNTCSEAVGHECLIQGLKLWEMNGQYMILNRKKRMVITRSEFVEHE